MGSRRTVAAGRHARRRLSSVPLYWGNYILLAKFLPSRETGLRLVFARCIGAAQRRHNGWLLLRRC